MNTPSPVPRPDIRTTRVGLDQSSKRFVVFCAVSVSSIIALAVIGVVALMPLLAPGYEVPETLANWGGLIIGFYFGSFITLLKDWSQESVNVHQSQGS
ncbi:hypothetical protein SAMN05421759_1216 [Roseivivax lentus]|uniref:Uncharacterized protein n=1 Tax=Roseivivax lentus TaxID=633194 RepID=A0A1N7PW32_9RHOB|nr:hypothetical protein [Roseivivax lentus]SIT14639.1 hypothetical protein SAMN05421759_1216 [Roseivivax lentus]